MHTTRNEKLYDTTQNNVYGLSESTWTDSFQPTITVQSVQRTVDMSQVLVDKLVDIPVSMQQQVPAVQVEQRTVELLHSSFSTAPGTHIANQAEHCGDCTGAVLEQGCVSGSSNVASLLPVKDASGVAVVLW